MRPMLACLARAIVGDTMSTGAQRATTGAGGEARGDEQEAEGDGKGFEGFHG